ncbi:MAG: RNA methyltransferase [Vagococcus sp.]
MKIIESTKNEWLKQVKKLEKKKFRDLENRYLIEGEHLVEEAINNEGDIQHILVTETSLVEFENLLATIDDEQLVLVTEDILKHLSHLPSVPSIMAIIGKGNQEKKETKTNHLLLLDNVQDPGNVGTMIRTADAAGFVGVILGEGSADIYNSKVLRSMQGSQFHLNLREANLLEIIETLKEEGYQIYATELNPEAIAYQQIETSEKIAFIMGNEGQGVSQELIEASHQTVYIPMKGKAESLNVAVAAGILMFSV